MLYIVKEESSIFTFLFIYIYILLEISYFESSYLSLYKYYL